MLVPPLTVTAFMSILTLDAEVTVSSEVGALDGVAGTSARIKLVVVLLTLPILL
jgi:hypothetical protein